MNIFLNMKVIYTCINQLSQNQYGYLTCVKYKNLFFTFSRSNDNSLLEITSQKTLTIIPVSIYNLNCDKSSFSKQGRHGMINFWKYEVEPSSFLYCIYICMKKSMYSQSIRNLSISILIVFNHLGT